MPYPHPMDSEDFLAGHPECPASAAAEEAEKLRRAIKEAADLVWSSPTRAEQILREALRAPH